MNWGIATNWVRDGTRFIANANVAGRPSSIWAVPVIGGAPRKLRDAAYAWAVSRDGSWVAFTSNLGSALYRELWRMRPDGGQATRLYEGDEHNGFFGADWSPDGQRLSYIGVHRSANKTEMRIESRDLTGGFPTFAAPGDVADWTWSPDGRMIYILPETDDVSGSCNFWAVRVDGRTGKPIGNPRRLTDWAGFCMEDPTVTADGKQLAFRKLSAQGTVFVAEVRANGTRISAPRRLTQNEGANYPAAWTADSTAVVFRSYREGQWSIFKQSLDQDTAEPLASGAQDVADPSATVSPNGDWVLYVASSKRDGSSSGGASHSLMRVPIIGGSAELVLTGPIYGKPACARAPVTMCVIAEQTPDRKLLVFTAFDPVKGRGGEVARFDTDPTADVRYLWDLSPEGRRVAILKYAKGSIDILRLDGHVPQKIVVSDWSSLLSLNWTSDGEGFFATGQTEKGSVVLRLDLRGNARVLWQLNGSTSPWNRPFAGVTSAPLAIPSPDGRHLAIYDWKLSANMWVMENF